MRHQSISATSQRLSVTALCPSPSSSLVSVSQLTNVVANKRDGDHVLHHVDATTRVQDISREDLTALAASTIEEKINTNGTPETLNAEPQETSTIDPAEDPTMLAVPGEVKTNA